MIKELVKAYLDEEKRVLDTVSLEIFDEIVQLVGNAYDRDNQIFVMGNGGSGSTASHFACDINKGVSFHLDRRFKVICLNDNIPTMLAYANDNSYDDIFVEQLKNFLNPGDVVIGFSGSGNSKNVIKAIHYANEHAAISVGFTGFEGGQLAKIAKIALVVPVNDMQKIEDIHLIFAHLIMHIFYKKLVDRNTAEVCLSSTSHIYADE